MSPLYTTPSTVCNLQLEANDLASTISPTLVFQKWQLFDDFTEFKYEKSRVEYLHNIAKLVEKTRKLLYTDWYNQYQSSMNLLGAESLPATSLWRLSIGFSTNPTLETGLTLHHLYGFPYIPGSALKGAVHHEAEQKLLEKLEEMELQAFQPEPVLKESELDDINKHLRKVEVIRELYGSIFEKSIKDTNSTTLRERLESLLEQANAGPTWDALKTRLKTILNTNTGGLVQFYDAVPDPDSKYAELLQVDILNPHYPDYYGDDNHMPPSDDQNPKPVYFLAVKPQTKFYFYYRVSTPAQPEMDKEAESRFHLLKNWVKDIDQDQDTCTQIQEALQQEVEKHLKSALAFRGLGAKTAAGYGYFDIPELHNS